LPSTQTHPKKQNPITHNTHFSLSLSHFSLSQSIHPHSSSCHCKFNSLQLLLCFWIFSQHHQPPPTLHYKTLSHKGRQEEEEEEDPKFSQTQHILWDKFLELSNKPNIFIF
jgi:hypothetical protein